MKICLHLHTFNALRLWTAPVRISLAFTCSEMQWGSELGSPFTVQSDDLHRHEANFTPPTNGHLLSLTAAMDWCRHP